MVLRILIVAALAIVLVDPQAALAADPPGKQPGGADASSIWAPRCAASSSKSNEPSGTPKKLRSDTTTGRARSSAR